MKIIAFDQSSNVTGWCVVTDGNYVESGVIDKKHIEDTNARIGEMGVAICQKIKETQPDAVVIEDIQNQGSIDTVVKLARLQGFILGWCHVHDLRIEIMRPSEWRKVLHFKQGAGVKRKELKQQSIDYVTQKYGTVLSEDESEACCICEAAWKKYFK